MPLVLTGTFDKYGVKHEFDGGEVEYTTNGQVGFVGTERSSVYLQPDTGDIYGVTNYGSIQQLRLVLQVRKSTNNASSFSLILRTYTAALYWTDAASLDTAIFASNSYDTVTTQDTTDAQQVVYTTTAAAEIERILKYGVGITSTDSDTVLISSAALEADAVSEYAKPVIAFVKEDSDAGYYEADGTYIHMPDSDFLVRYTYEQEMDVSMAFLGVEVINERNAEGDYSTGYTGNPFAVPIAKWGYFPQEGRIGLRAISEENVASDIIYLPYKIAHKDTKITSHISGTIIQSDADITITWENTLPEEFRTAPDPMGYYVWIWWDDGERTTSAVEAEASYTISAEELAGHSRLHFAVTPIYGAGVEGEGTAEPALTLYIQQTAGTSGVEVAYRYASVDGVNIYSPSPKVMWESTGQAAFQVRVGEFTSPVVWGTARSYLVPYIFENGTYPVQVRVQDQSGSWTDWTEPVYAFLGNDVPGGSTTTGACTVSAEKSGQFVRIRAEDDGANAYLEWWCVYRNGVMIAQLPHSRIMEYIDKYAHGVCSYFVRAVGGVWTYNQSNTVTLNATPKYDMINPIGTDEIIPLLYTASFPRSYRITTTEETSLQHYAGRRLPVSMRSGRYTEQLPLEYLDTNGSAFARLRELTGAPVVFKSTLGERFIGELNSVTRGTGRLYNTVSFTLTGLDFEDAVPFVREDI